MFRGLLAIVLGAAALIMPDMARSLLLLPLATAVSVIYLIIYGVLDSLAVLIASFFTEVNALRPALRIHGMFGICIGMILFFVAFNQVSLYWFLLLIASQVLNTAISELPNVELVRLHLKPIWRVGTLCLAVAVAVIYVLLALINSDHLRPSDIMYAVYGYLAMFGTIQVLLSTSMLRQVSSLTAPAPSHVL